MKKKMISALITAFLIFTILLLIVLFISNYFLGVYYKNIAENNLIHDKLVTQLDAKESAFLNEYHLTETTYISLIDEEYIWYNQEVAILARREEDSYDELAIRLQCEQLLTTNCEIEYGYYKEKPMIVIENEDKEILLDYDTLEVMLIYEKKVVQ